MVERFYEIILKCVIHRYFRTKNWLILHYDTENSVALSAFFKNLPFKSLIYYFILTSAISQKLCNEDENCHGKYCSRLVKRRSQWLIEIFPKFYSLKMFLPVDLWVVNNRIFKKIWIIHNVNCTVYNVSRYRNFRVVWNFAVLKP